MFRIISFILQLEGNSLLPLITGFFFSLRYWDCEKRLEMFLNMKTEKIKKTENQFVRFRLKGAESFPSNLIFPFSVPIAFFPPS